MEDTPLWLTPLIFLPGVALLVMSTASRYSDLLREVHELTREPEFERDFSVERLISRAVHFRNALVSLYLAAVLLSIGSLAGLASPISLLVLMAISVSAVAYAAIHLVAESSHSLRIIKAHFDRQRRLARS